MCEQSAFFETQGWKTWKGMEEIRVKEVQLYVSTEPPGAICRDEWLETAGRHCDERPSSLLTYGESP